MPAVAREWKVTYGALVVGGTTDRLLDGPYLLGDDGRTFELAFAFVATAASEGAWAAEQATIEAALATPWQDLKIELGSTTILDRKGSDGTGLNLEARFTKERTPHHSGRSARYEVTITGGRPSDTAARAGRRDFAWSLRLDAARLGTLVVRGSYTKVGGTAARAQYLAQVDARVATITTALTGKWALVDEVQDPVDDQDHTVGFARTYRELVFNETAGVLDDPRIGEQTLAIVRQRVGRTGLAEETPLQGVVATYVAAVRKDQVTGIEALRALWTDAVRPHVLASMALVTGGESLTVTAEDADVDPVANRIRARLVAIAPAGGTILAKRMTTRDQIQRGRVIRKTWDKPDAGADALPQAYVFRHPRTHRRSVTITTRALGVLSPADPGLPFPEVPVPGTVRRAVVLAQGQTTETSALGIADLGVAMDVTDLVQTAELEFLGDDPPAGAAAGAGQRASGDGSANNVGSTRTRTG